MNAPATFPGTDIAIPARAWPPLGVECYAYRNSYATPGNNYTEGNVYETQAGADAEAAANPTFERLRCERIRTVFEVVPAYLRAERQADLADHLYDTRRDDRMVAEWEAGA